MKIKILFGEPIVQFFILGILLFFIVSYVQKSAARESREILIDNDEVAQMIIKYKAQSGNLPTKQQLDAVIDEYIKTEVFYREAKKMGLHNNDEIVRRRLAQKLAFMKNDLTELEEPSITELQLFYKNNPSIFQRKATVSFSHIYFTADNIGEKISSQRASTVLNKLKNSTVQRAPNLGDRFPLQYDYTEQSIIDVQQNFGNSTMVDSLFQSEENKWIGPVRSGYGWHLIFISNRKKEEIIPFEMTVEDVKANYLEVERLALNQQIYDQMKKKYVINRNYLISK